MLNVCLFIYVLGFVLLLVGFLFNILSVICQVQQVYYLEHKVSGVYASFFLYAVGGLLTLTPKIIYLFGFAVGVDIVLPAICNFIISYRLKHRVI